jgi:hypothetical protein
VVVLQKPYGVSHVTLMCKTAVEHYLNHGCCLAFTTKASLIPAVMYWLAGLMNFTPDRRLTFTVRSIHRQRDLPGHAQHKAPSPEEERDALREDIARLNQEIQRQQMELDILEKAEEIIKKDPGISINNLSNRGKKQRSLMP